MFARTSIAGLIAFVFWLAMIQLGSTGALAQRGPDPGEAPSRARPVEEEAKDENGSRAAKKGDRVIMLYKPSMKKLTSMPDGQRIRVKGAEMTVGEYKAKVLRERERSVANHRGMRGRVSQVNIEALQKDFDQKEEGRLKNANAKVAAELAKLGQRESRGNGNDASMAEIRKEAAEIQARTKGGRGTPEDLARALQLLQEYQDLQ